MKLIFEMFEGEKFEGTPTILEFDTDSGFESRVLQTLRQLRAAHIKKISGGPKGTDVPLALPVAEEFLVLEDFFKGQAEETFKNRPLFLGGVASLKKQMVVLIDFFENLK